MRAAMAQTVRRMAPGTLGGQTWSASPVAHRRTRSAETEKFPCDVFDDFHRLNGPIGQARTHEIWNPYSSGWHVHDRAAHMNTAGAAPDSSSIVTVPCGGDGSVEVSLDPGAIGDPFGGHGAGMIVRASSESSFIAFFIFASTLGFHPGSAYGRKYVAGVGTDYFSNVTTGLTFPLPSTLRMEMSGSSLTFICNGVTIGTYTDTFNETAVDCGLLNYGNNSRAPDLSDIFHRFCYHKDGS